MFSYKQEVEAGHFCNFEPIYKLLKRFPFFNNYKSGHCQKIVEQAELIQFKKLDLIFRQGQNSDDFYFLLYGSVQNI